MEATLEDGDTTMFRIRDLKNGYFQIHTTGKAFEGPAKQTFETALDLGILQSHLGQAIYQLTGWANYADFNKQGELICVGKDKGPIRS